MAITDPLLQKYYGDLVGSVEFFTRQATAGSRINCRLTINVGKTGIDESGAIKILFRIVTDAGMWQFTEPEKDNFVQWKSTNKDVEIVSATSSTAGFQGKMHTRPWNKGCQLLIKNSFLKEGDQIIFDVLNWRTQTFCQNKFEIRVLVDPFATGKYIEALPAPDIQILPDKPVRVVVIAPSKVKTNVPFDALIKLEDKWGNPCTTTVGKSSFKITGQKGLDQTVRINNGISRLRLKFKQPGISQIIAKFNNLEGESNPISAENSPELLQFWGDLHGQSDETVGTNNIEEYFHFAKNFSLLDFAGHQANDFQITNEFWKKINGTTKRFNQDGKFVALPGYEWSGNTSNGGDRNVIFEEENQPIFRSSHALIDDFSDIKSDANTIGELFNKLKSHRALVIAHAGGRYSDLSVHDSELERLVEVHSMWGEFEWLLFEALGKGYKFGIVANSDDHFGRPGAAGPGRSEFGCFGGLTCILTDKLSRKGIFQALRDRHCFGTTGARINLDVSVGVGQRKKVIMGDEIELSPSDNPHLSIKVLGTCGIDRIDILNGQKIIKAWTPKPEKDQAIKITWAGAASRGRSRRIEWKGDIKFSGNSIIGELQKINFFNDSHFVQKKDDKNISFSGVTTGNFQGFKIMLEKLSGKILISTRGKNLVVPVTQIKQDKPTILPFGGQDARMEFIKIPFVNPENDVKLNFELEKLNSGVNPIIVRVIQSDGHKAWSSPIFITYKGN